MFNPWSLWTSLISLGRKKLEYRLRFTSDAASSYDSLKSNGDPRFDRVKQTLDCLKYGRLRYPLLQNRRWRQKVPPNTPVYQSCISQSRPDFLIIWHYSHQDESAIVIMLIDLIN